MAKSIYAEFRETFGENKPVQHKRNFKPSMVVSLVAITVLALFFVI